MIHTFASRKGNTKNAPSQATRTKEMPSLKSGSNKGAGNERFISLTSYVPCYHLDNGDVVSCSIEVSEQVGRAGEGEEADVVETVPKRRRNYRRGGFHREADVDVPMKGWEL